MRSRGRKRFVAERRLQAGRAGVRSDRMLLLAVPCAAAADLPLHSAARFDYVRGFAPVSSLGLALATPRRCSSSIKTC
jgi:hypothetical protein